MSRQVQLLLESKEKDLFEQQSGTDILTQFETLVSEIIVLAKEHATEGKQELLMQKRLKK